MENYQIIVNGATAVVVTPYNPDFVAKIKLLHGKWDSANRRWNVPSDAVEEVRAAMREIYGRDDRESGETVSVKLSFTKRLYEDCAPITLFGKVIAAAHGRDSGARAGEDVYFVSGKPTSGGSLKNWVTAIPDGSVCIVKNVQKSVFDTAALPDGVTAEIVPISPDRDALRDEKERLLARIADIDRLLTDVTEETT